MKLIMKMLLSIMLLLVLVSPLFAQAKTDMWNEFAKTKFEPRYFEKLGEYQYYPNFTAELKALVGKEITLQGFYVPYSSEEGNYIILSKFPMSQCFFCGVGGPESIAEVTFKDGSTKFQVDDLINIKGKLKLNADDVEHFNFIIIDAVLVKK